MKIDFTSDDTCVPFVQLECGDIFMYNDSFYIKCSAITSKSLVYNAVRLSDGCMTNLDFCLVKPVKLKAVVDD